MILQKAKGSASQSRTFSLEAVLVICGVGLLFALGAAMVFGTSSAVLLDRIDFAHTNRALLRQLLYALAGIALAYGMFRCGYDNFLNWSGVLLAIITLCLVLCYLPGIKRPFNGANRWIGFKSITFQPSEFAKLIIPSFLISRFSGKGKARTDLERCFWKSCSAIFPALFLVFIAPDNRTTLLLISSCALVFALCLIPARLWLVPLVLFLGIGGAVASQLPYVQSRVRAYLQPTDDLLGRAHQPYQAKIAAGSGGMFGVGLGRSLQKYNYLPEAQNDYIAAIFAEELGFFGVLALITTYAGLALFCWRLSMNCEDAAGSALGIVLTYLIAIQSFVNLGVVSGLLPATGLNLPFFSQGGTSLWSNFIAIALLISIGERRFQLNPNHWEPR